MRLVHDENQVGQACKVVKIALPQVFRKAFDLWRFAAAHFGIDLGNIEDVDLDRRINRLAYQVAALLVGFACNDFRHGGCKFCYPLKHILGRVGREVPYQLVVDGEVGGENEEVLVPIRGVQVADECAHQARLAYARG